MTHRADVERLMRAHQVDIWRFLRVLGCEAALAEDLTQDVFLSLLTADFEEVSRASTLAYLRRTARNLFITAMRKQRVRAAISNFDEIEADWAAQAGDDGGQSRLEALRACLGGLDDRQREALLLRYGREATRSELAKRLSLSEGGTKNLLERVKVKLRECIERRLKHAL